MKIGVISDIHSNILALEAVFNKFEEKNINDIICLGDIIGIGPYPEKCIDLLMKNKEKIIGIVKGNHENYLIKGLPKTNHNIENGTKLSDEEKSTHVWNHSKLSTVQIEFIKELKSKEIININNKNILICHYPLLENGKFKKFYKNMNEQRVDELFNNQNIDIFLFGHTHKEYYFKNDKKIVINPGSLGCPKNTNAALAGILDISNNDIIYEELRVTYNIDEAVESIKKLNYPLSRFMIKTFYR